MIRPFVLYPLLVGIPVLGVVGVLRAGARLQAPPSVGGAWSVEAAARAADAACAARYSPAELRISQSGTHLALVWGGPRGATLRGTLDGGRLTAVEMPSGGGAGSAAGCADGRLRVEGEIGPEARPAAFRGTVSIDGCGACPSTGFDAVRQAPAVRRGGAGH